MKPSIPLVCFTHKLFIGLAVLITIMPVHGQVSTPCTNSIISSFTPCMNFLTNSSLSGGDSPMQDCCGSLKSLTGKGLDCLCLIVTGQVPFQIPINRILAISLPKVCKMSGVPVECKASAAPIPAPGPAALGPDSPLSPSDEPSTPEGDSPPLSPEADTPPPLFTPPSPPTDSFTPPSPPATIFPGTKPDLSPSAAPRLIIINSVVLLQLQALGFVFLKYY